MLYKIKEFLREPKAWIEIATLFFVAYYACLTQQLVTVNHEQVTTAELRFRQERAAILDVAVQGAANGPVVKLTNTGATEARDVVIRLAYYEFHGPSGTPFKMFYPSRPAPIQIPSPQPIPSYLPPNIRKRLEQDNAHTRDELARWQEIETKSWDLEEQFYKWVQPDLDFTMQAPVLPGDSVFQELKAISEQQRALELANLQEVQKHIPGTNVGQAIATLNSEIPPGTMLEAVGPLDANTAIQFSLSEVNTGPTRIIDVAGPGGITIDYVAIRVSYTDHWNKPVSGDNLCLSPNSLQSIFSGSVPNLPLVLPRSNEGMKRCAQRTYYGPSVPRWCRSSGGKAIGATYQRVLQLNVYRLIAS